MHNTGKDINSIKNFNKYFAVYLSFLLFFGIYFLYSKHNVGNDTSISEYLVNYQGGFVRRGLIGDIIFRYSEYLNLNLRFQIFIFQSVIYSTFLILVFNFFKNFEKNVVIMFAIYTPIFLLFPVAELESLGRKEPFLYVFFLTLIMIKNVKHANIFIFFILPVFCMVYEEIILFSPFIYSVILIKNKISDFKSAIKLSLLFLPSIIIVLYFFTNPLSMENHKVMADSLINVFGESCYMSCWLLVGNDINSFNSMINYIWSGPHVNLPEIFIRYSLVFLIGFFPIFFLSYHSSFKKDFFFYKIKLKNILLFLLISYIPIVPLYILGGDWGRWTNMTITFTIIFYFYLYKNNFIDIDYMTISKKLFFFKDKKKLVTLIFIIFAFSWNQKTTNVEDIATNPMYRIPYKAGKEIFGWQSFRFFQDHQLIKFHKKYVE